jgi:hypothetical protein
MKDQKADGRGGPASWAPSDAGLPFCGHEYPPLRASPGAVICTKPCHPETERHLNEETGWVWWADQ